MTHRQYLVPLDISAKAYERLYRGTAQSVVARDTSGRSIRFPASALRPFITREGIQGLFVIRVDSNNKLIDISRKTP